MSPEVKQHVFEPFFTTKEVGRGSGLGLAQVHGFATQSRGRVRIDTEVGKGTTVMLLLPRSTDAPGPDPGHCANIDTPPQPSGSTGCVLLVEDDDEVAVLVSEMLGQLGYEVTRVASAAAALGALANGRHVDVVLSDIMMPGGMNGVELAREVRRRRSGLPILLTSGYAEASSARRTRRREDPAEALPSEGPRRGTGPDIAADPALTHLRDDEDHQQIGQVNDTAAGSRNGSAMPTVRPTAQFQCTHIRSNPRASSRRRCRPIMVSSGRGSGGRSAPGRRCTWVHWRS
jgi:CheY-like chemotaxis protein